MQLGILHPRFCKYTERECIIEFGVICHILKATSGRARSKVADCVRELHGESYFEYPKAWIDETSEEDGEEIVYSYPPKLVVRVE
jgi:hypothetical protein